MNRDMLGPRVMSLLRRILLVGRIATTGALASGAALAAEHGPDDGPVSSDVGRSLPFPVVDESAAEGHPPFTAPSEWPDDLVYLSVPGFLSWEPHQNTLGMTTQNFESISVRSSAVSSGKVTIAPGALTYLTEVWPASSPLIDDAVYWKGEPHAVVDFDQAIVVRRDVTLQSGASVVIGSNVFTYVLSLGMTGTSNAAISVASLSGRDWAPAGVGAFVVSTTQPVWAPKVFRHTLYQGSVDEVTPAAVRFRWLSSNRMDSVVLAGKTEFSGLVEMGKDISLPGEKRFRVVEIDVGNRQVSVETPEGPHRFSFDFDPKLLAEDTSARRKVLWVGKDFAAFLNPLLSSLEEGKVYFDIYSQLRTLRYGETVGEAPAWKVYPIGCYTGHVAGLYVVNDKAVELSPEQPVMMGPEGRFKLVTEWSAQELRSFHVEDAKGGKSFSVPAAGRKSINLLAGEGPSVQGIFGVVGPLAAAQLNGLLTGVAPKPFKAATAAPAAQGQETEPGWRFKVAWSMVGGGAVALVVGLFVTRRRKDAS
jgi:hypothetical protein